MPRLVLASIFFVCALAPPSRAGQRSPALDEYRHFRALTIDLRGRLPTRAELRDFESSTFDLSSWIDARLNEAPYANRLTRVYLDALRLQLGPSFQFVPGLNILRREPVIGPDGSPLYIYFRSGQRRARPETDGTFCLTLDETGQQYPPNTAPTVPDGGAQVSVSQATLDQYTVLVSPWWLYADSDTAAPADRVPFNYPAPQADGGTSNPADYAAWIAAHPNYNGYRPAAALLSEQADGGPPQLAQIRICKEEAQAGATGTVLATGRCTAANPQPWCAKGSPPPFGRLSFPPNDSAYAAAALAASKATPPQPLPQVDCASKVGFANSAECGCGPGLQRCYPSPSPAFESSSLVFPGVDPMGSDTPIVEGSTQPISAWNRQWWGEEASHFLSDLFANDRPFTEVLTARRTFVNGPLAQFYKSSVNSTCCDAPAVAAGMLSPVPLFDPANLPSDLNPMAASDWRPIPDRGPHASGILTMPVFLTKYGSRRARAHVLYQAFLCRDFQAPNLTLKPSTNPNLMQRDGCMACHVKLEPMAAYFSRIPESDWVWLPQDKFPVRYGGCRLDTNGNPVNKAPDAGPYGGRLGFNCTQSYYDPAFGDADAGTLRGAYPDIPAFAAPDAGTPVHADEGPAGLAQELFANPEFDACVAQTVAQSFLGRALTRDDDALLASLTQTFVDGGRKPKALVKAVLMSDPYLHGNNLSSQQWRSGK
jgi:Protein of unknown function (DUF1585)